MQSRFFHALSSQRFLRVHYTEWGEAENPRVLVCAHGLTRNARDFDRLAEAMSDAYRVVCIDFPGRGESDWLDNKAEYGVELYAQVATALIARLGVERVDWFGTSLGGLVAMAMAARAGVPFRRLVLNDVGPLLPKAALARIAQYVGTVWEMDSLEAVEAHLRTVHQPFGPLTDEQWRHLAEHSHIRRDDGRYLFHYDPGIAEVFSAMAENDVDLWPVYDLIRTPTLLLRGAESDVLPADVARQMAERGPRAVLREFAGVGHAPMLMDPDQIAVVRDWLLGDNTP